MLEPTVLIEQWTYLGVLLVSFMGQIGFPIPEEVVFIMAGYLASGGFVSFWGILFFCIFVIVLTNNVSYWVGYFFGSRLLKFLSRLEVFRIMICKTENLFLKHGKKTIFISRFIWNFRNWTPLLAGVHKMNWWEFQKSDLAAAVIYTPILVGLGYFFAEILDVVIGRVLEVRFLIFVFFVVLVMIYVLRLFYVKFFFRSNCKKKNS